jgi:hypothetical protein
MWTQTPAPTDEGLTAAMDRARAAGLDPNRSGRDGVGEAQEAVGVGVRFLTGDEPARFVALFSELVGVAALARAAYDDHRLEGEDLSAFVPALKGFLNSWSHHDENR